MTGDSIDLERHLQVPPARVWAALTDPSQAGTWFVAKARITPELGGAYELVWDPDTPRHHSTIGCRITAIAPRRYLAFTWRGPDELSAIMNEGDPPPPPTHVTISLATSPLRHRHPGAAHRIRPGRGLGASPCRARAGMGRVPGPPGGIPGRAPPSEARDRVTAGRRKITAGRDARPGSSRTGKPSASQTRTVAPASDNPARDAMDTSVRVMGTSFGMGHAAGVAAGVMRRQPPDHLRGPEKSRSDRTRLYEDTRDKP